MKRIKRLLFFALLLVAGVMVFKKYGPKFDDIAKWWENAEFDIVDIASDAITEVKKGMEQSSGNFDVDEATMFVEEYPIWEDALPMKKIADVSEVPDSVKITVSGCSLYVKESADGCVYVEGTGGYRLQSYVKDNILYMNVVSKGEITSANETVEATLYLPGKWNYFDTSISVGAGNVEMDKLSTASLNAEVGAGNLLLKDVVAAEVKLSVGAGNITFNGEVNKALEAEATAGMLGITLSGDVEDFNYDVSRVAGVIEIGDTSLKDTELSTTIDNGASKTASLKCAVGKIELSFTPNI